MSIRDDMTFIYKEVPEMWAEIAYTVLKRNPDEETFVKAVRLRRMIFNFKDYGWTEVHSLYIPLLTEYIKEYRERGQRDL